MTANNQSLLHQLNSDTSNTSVPGKPSTSLCSTTLSQQVSYNPVHDHTYYIKSFHNEDNISKNANSSFATPIEAIFIPDVKIELDLDECEISLEDPFKNHNGDIQPPIQIEKPSNTASSSLPGTERLQHSQEPRQLAPHTSISDKSSFCVLSNTQLYTSTNSPSSSLSDLNLLQYLVKKYHIKDLTVRMSRLSDQVLDSLQKSGTVDCNVVDTQMSEKRNVRIKLEPVTVDPCVCDDQVSDNLQQNLSSTVDDNDIEVPFEAIYDRVIKCEPDLAKSEPSLDLSADQSENRIADNWIVTVKQEVIGNSEAHSDAQPDFHELEKSPRISNPSNKKDINISAPVFCCANSNFSTKCRSKITSLVDNQHVEMSSYQCHECGKSLKYKNSKHRHISLVHPNNCSYNSKRGFKLETSCSAHFKNHDKIFQCDVCGKVLSSKQRLTEHNMSIHTKSSPLSCDMCSKIFYTEARLKGHTRQVHSNLSCKCNICDKSCKIKPHLNAYQRQVHASVHAFSCNRCEKTFVSKCKLKAHSVVHSDLRPFKCDKCGSCFNLSSNLTRHIRTVHSNVRAFKCHLCGKSFKSKDDLRKHLISHSDVRDYKCEQCGKQFKTTAELKLHLARHSDIRPFACAQCHKKFKSKRELVAHLRHVHSDLRPFSCDKCSLACKSKSDLKVHQVVHSNVRKFECFHCKRKFKYRNVLSVHIKTKHSDLN